MSSLKKSLNLPDEYDPAQMKLVFENIIDGTQSRYLTSLTEAPKTTDGKDGELRVDNTSGKLYIKINGAWKSFTPDI